MLIIITSDKKRQVIDITELIGQKLEGNGVASIFTRHTTAAITTADLDPGTDLDILDAIDSITPKLSWRHPHDPSHFPDHLWSSLIGPGIVIPYSASKLELGTWQRLVFIELDGPRERTIDLTLLKS